MTVSPTRAPPPLGLRDEDRGDRCERRPREAAAQRQRDGHERDAGRPGRVVAVAERDLDLPRGAQRGGDEDERPEAHAATVRGRGRGVLRRGEEPDLLLEDETGARIVRRDEARIARAPDDGSRVRADGVRMTAITSSPATTRLAGAARPRPARRLALGPRVRRVWLTVHIVSGVGLLGTVAAVLALNIRAATTGDTALAAATYELLAMFTVLFGIPLSFGALGSGVVLGLGSKWGVVRHGWVAAKLVLLVGVILVGALVLGPGTDAMRTGDGGAQTRLVAGSAYDVLALLTATGLSVFKPRRRR